MQFKKCTACKETLPASEFHKMKHSPDGLQYKCKTCKKAFEREYLKTKSGKESRARGQKAYRSTEHGKAKHREQEKQRYYSNSGREYQKQYYKKNLHKIKARKAVNHAVEAGKLPRIGNLSCSNCNKQAQSYHHHKGYDRPNWLEVIPLCFSCDRAMHCS